MWYLDSSRRKARSRAQRGFSLVEVVWSSALLAGTILSVTVVSLGAHQLHRQIEEKDAALGAIQQELQAVEATPFVDILATHDGRGFGVVPDGAGGKTVLNAQAGDEDGLPGRVIVTVPDPPGAADRLLQVVVRVDWAGPNGPQSLQRTLLLSAKGSL